MKTLTKLLTISSLICLGLSSSKYVKAQKPQESSGVAIVYLSSHLNLRKVSLEIDSVKNYNFCVDSIKTDFKLKTSYLKLLEEEEVPLPPVKTFIVTKNKNQEQIVIPLNFKNGYSYDEDSESSIKNEIKKYVKEPFKLTEPVDYGSKEMFLEIIQTKRK